MGNRPESGEFRCRRYMMRVQSFCNDPSLTGFGAFTGVGKWDIAHRALKRGDNRVGYCSGPIATAEFASPHAVLICAVDRSLDPFGGRGRRRMIVLLRKPIEHQSRGENHGGRICDSLAGNVGRGPMARLENRVLIANVG
jgi:hypothetical protein